MSFKKVLFCFSVVLVIAAAILVGCSETGNPGGDTQIHSSRQFVVFFNPDGGVPARISSVTVDSGASLGVLPAGPEKEEHVFLGWFDSADTLALFTEASIITKSITLVAKYRKLDEGGEDGIYYTLVTNVTSALGGTVSRDPDRESYGSGVLVTVTATANPGYAFTGWSGVPDSVNAAEASIQVVMNSDLELVAGFLPVYALITNSNPGAGGSVTLDPGPPYTFGKQVTATASPAEGYTFIGWSGAPEGTNFTDSSITFIMDGDLALTANFLQHELFLGIGEAWVNDKASGSRNGYIFLPTGIFQYINDYGDGWAIDHESTWSTREETLTLRGTERVSYEVSDNVLALLYDNGFATAFTKTGGVMVDGVERFLLKTDISPANGGVVHGVSDQQRYISGRRVAVTAEPADGYTFIGWSGAVSSVNPDAVITMDGDRTLTAHFRPSSETYTLTTNVNLQADGSVGGSVSPAGNSTHNAGASVTVTATPRPGYRFVGWAGASVSVNNPVTLTMNGNQTLTANFEVITYTLATAASPAFGGTVSRSPELSSYVAGTQVSVTAVPAGTEMVEVEVEGEDGEPETIQHAVCVMGEFDDEEDCYEFIGWSGASTSTDMSVTVTMDANLTLTAHFRLVNVIRYTLTVESTAGGSVVSVVDDPDVDDVDHPSQASYAFGQLVTVRAVPEPGYRFTGWSGAVTSTEASITVTMTGNLNLIANFERE